MSRIIIVSSEVSFPNEIEIVLELLELDKNFRFHLRKPDWSKERLDEYLKLIPLNYHERISIHSHLELVQKHTNLSAHYTEKSRSSDSINSTSFHSKEDAENMHENFDYFFCSPVFESISKKGYSPFGNWDINSWSGELKSKAVALGGMNSDTIIQAKKLGFENFAFLGAIWLDKNPLTALKNILNHAK